MKKSTRISAYITIFFCFCMFIFSIAGENYLAIIGWIFALIFLGYCFYYDFLSDKDPFELEKEYDELISELHKRLISKDESYWESDLYTEADKKLQQHENKLKINADAKNS